MKKKRKIPAQPATKVRDNPSVVELEAALLEQEHRLFRVLSNWWHRSQYEQDDPRRKAVTHALIWRVLFSKGATTVATGGIGIVSLFALYFAWQANQLTDEQNATIREQTELSRAQLEHERRQSVLTELDRRRNRLDSIIEKVSREIKIQQENGDSMPDSGWALSDLLVAQINTLSASLHPHVPPDFDAPEKFVIRHYAPKPEDQIADAETAPNVDERDLRTPLRPDWPLSPERALLLVFLHSAKVDLQTLKLSLEYADLRGAYLKNVRFPYYMNFNRAALNGSRIESCNFPSAKFLEADLAYTTFMTCEFYDGHFHGSKFLRTGFYDSELNRARLDDCVFRETAFFNCSLHDSDMSRVNAAGTGFGQTDFTNVKLANANFENCALLGATFKGASVDGLNLRGAQLGPPPFSRTSPGGADLSSFFEDGSVEITRQYLAADFRGVTGLRPAQVQNATFWYRAEYDAIFKSRLGLTEQVVRELESQDLLRLGERMSN